MQIRPTAFTIGLIIYSFIALFFVYTEFGIDSQKNLTPYWENRTSAVFAALAFSL
jgi:membrane-anchored glycerophosphoryl diester phosphodiesterase (GDPDase)